MSNARTIDASAAPAVTSGDERLRTLLRGVHTALRHVLLVFPVLLVLTVVACVYFPNTVKITM